MTLLDGGWTQDELLALRPPGRLSVSEWAERFRQLDTQAARRGPWSNETLPYLVEPMDCFSDAAVEKVTVKFPAQCGKSEVMINAICWAVDQDPDPIMVVQPDKDLAKQLNIDRVQPAFRATQAIARHDTGIKRDRSNHLVRLRPCNIIFASANSPSDLASRPIRWLFLDETDKYPRWSGREAAPCKLAEKRTTTYPDAKIGLFCTPTTEDGVITESYEESDARQFWVPCPHCEERQVLVLERLKWPEETAPKVIRHDRSSWYVCEHCDEPIPDDTGTLRRMLEQGEWRPRDPEDIGNPHRGYHINGLYSPFLDWSQLAAEFLETKDEPSAYMDFLNSRMATAWVASDKGVDDEFLSGRMDGRKAGIVPMRRQVVLTLGCDVGGPEAGPFRWDWAVRAWAAGMRSWLVAYGTLTSYDFTEFRDQVLYRSWEDGEGRLHYVERALMDDGWNTDKVKDWCRDMDPLLYPCKGLESQLVPIRTKMTDGLEVRYLDVNAIKDTLYNLMGRPSDHPGKWTTHSEICDKYRKHMCTEHRVPPRKMPGKRAKGRSKVWRVKHGLGSPHFWDAEVYALAAAKDLGLHESGEAWRQPSPDGPNPGPAPAWDEMTLNQRESRRRRRARDQDGVEGPWLGEAGDYWE